jgi:hypothetical protein
VEGIFCSIGIKLDLALISNTTMASEACEFSSCEEDPPEESSEDDCGDGKPQIAQRLGDSESDPDVSDQSSEELSDSEVIGLAEPPVAALGDDSVASEDNDAIPNTLPAAAPAAAAATSKKTPVKGN